jgi:hypothetical protein
MFTTYQLVIRISQPSTVVSWDGPNFHVFSFQGINPRRMVVPAITDLDMDTFDDKKDSQVTEMGCPTWSMAMQQEPIYWRYLPYIRHIVQGIYTQNMA